MSIYERYAEIYDRSGQMAFSLRMIPYVSQVLEQRAFVPESVLDLACGTGTLALAFAQRGWRVYGVDASAAMLEQARRKADQLGLTVLFSQQDMRSFVLPERVDLVTCLFDSLNYLLTVEDLERAFRRVAAHLKPGGLFLCDMNTIWALSQIWDDNTYFQESEGLSIVMQSQYNPTAHVATVRLVAFIRRDGLFERIEETHAERAYAERTVAAAMRRARLEVLDRYEAFAFHPPVSSTPRILWVARPRPVEAGP